MSLETIHAQLCFELLSTRQHFDPSMCQVVEEQRGGRKKCGFLVVFDCLYRPSHDKERGSGQQRCWTRGSIF